VTARTRERKSQRGPIALLLSWLNPIATVIGLALALWKVAIRTPLAWSMSQRDLYARHKGQMLGSLWPVVHPFMQMIIFLFIFGVVFQTRIENNFEMPRDYPTYMLAGLMPWLACLPAIVGCCSSVLGSASLVKQFNFDTFVLPIRDVLGTIPFWIVGIAFITIYSYATTNELPWTYSLLPPVLLATFLLLVGLGWLLSAISVFFRDLKEIITVSTLMFVYILPIVYLPEWTPPAFQTAILFNPFSYLIWVYQDIFYFGRIAHPLAWWVTGSLALLVLATGYRVFKTLRTYFGNVL
jgi:lipopolysaccharide transport system permease protein